jgi:hypothetical protein
MKWKMVLSITRNSLLITNVCSLQKYVCEETGKKIKPTPPEMMYPLDTISTMPQVRENVFTHFKI